MKTMSSLLSTVLALLLSSTVAVAGDGGAGAGKIPLPTGLAIWDRSTMTCFFSLL